MQDYRPLEEKKTHHLKKRSQTHTDGQTESEDEWSFEKVLIAEMRCKKAETKLIENDVTELRDDS
jgi:hypothetical protein